MLIVNTNTGSLTTQAALNQNTNSLQTAMTRLSTGLRINSAADDPSGLNIAQKMQTRVTGLDQANQNTYESISLAQTADSAMTQMYNNLNRMRQIAVQAANGTTNRQDRAGLQKELNQLAAEVTRITNSTEYNGRNLFSSSKPTKKASTCPLLCQGRSAKKALGTNKTTLISRSVSTAVREIEEQL